MTCRKILSFSFILFASIYFITDTAVYSKFKNHKKYYLDNNSLYKQSLYNISKNFLGKDYSTEQETDFLEEPPIFNTNNFNCLTFVEMVLVFHISNGFNELYENLKKIKYKNGNVNFLDRNHFITIDWIPNNDWLLRDSTKNIVNNYKTKVIQINKKSWMIKNHNKLYNSLQEKIDFKPIWKTINYIVKEDIIDYNEDFIKNLPNESIIFIVKDLKDIRKKIGTDLDVTHTGFLFKKENIFRKYFKKNSNKYKLVFRHASSVENKIVDVDFKKYLEKSKSIQGIIVITLNENYK